VKAEIRDNPWPDGKKPLHPRHPRSDDTFFKDVSGNVGKAAGQVDEIKLMMEAMYRKFSEEHGLKQPPPHPSPP